MGTAVMSITAIPGATGADPPSPWGAYLGLFLIAVRASFTSCVDPLRNAGKFDTQDSRHPTVGWDGGDQTMRGRVWWRPD